LQADTVDVIVVIRGGGSADDLQAFSTESVTRAVAASRIPTVVEIGHESDTSLAELAADLRASTPSNAAELITPDRKDMLSNVDVSATRLNSSVKSFLSSSLDEIHQQFSLITSNVLRLLKEEIKLANQLKHTVEV